MKQGGKAAPAVARPWRAARAAGLAAGLIAAGAAGPAAAQQYSQFLQCRGTLTVPGQAAREAGIDLALRQNDRSALIEASNVLPVGEVLRFVPTPSRYTMTYLLPRKGTLVFGVPGWWSATILVLYPDLERLNQVRLSIDRHSGALQGQLLNERDGLLAALAMQCAQRPEADAAPRL